MFQTENFTDNSRLLQRIDFTTLQTREDVRAALQAEFPAAFVYVGGHHVALHLGGPKDGQSVLITSDGPDWK